MRCAGCARTIPNDAVFCIYCAAPVGEARTPEPQAQPRPATGPTVRLRPTDVRTVAPSQQPVTVAPIAPAKVKLHKHSHKKHKHKKHKHDDPSGPIFIIGILALIFTGNFWPGILILLGITGFINQSAKGHGNHALGHAVFWLGLAALMYTGTSFFWPGVILVIIASHIISKQQRHTWI